MSVEGNFNFFKLLYQMKLFQLIFLSFNLVLTSGEDVSILRYPMRREVLKTFVDAFLPGTSGRPERGIIYYIFNLLACFISSRRFFKFSFFFVSVKLLLVFKIRLFCLSPCDMTKLIIIVQETLNKDMYFFKLNNYFIFVSRQSTFNVLGSRWNMRQNSALPADEPGLDCPRVQ